MNLSNAPPADTRQFDHFAHLLSLVGHLAWIATHYSLNVLRIIRPTNNFNKHRYYFYKVQHESHYKYRPDSKRQESTTTQVTQS